MNNKRTTTSLLSSHSSSTYLPARIIAACLEFALDGQDIARSQSVCRGWHLPENLVDILFHTRYLQQFEARTVDTPEIAKEGAATTPWKTRYRRRLQVRRNWESGRYKTSTVKIQSRATFGGTNVLIVPETNLLLVWSAHRFLTLFCTTDGSEVAQSTVVIDTFYKKQVATNGRSVFCIPGDQHENKVVELDIPDLQLIHSYPFPRFVEKISVEDNILVGIRHTDGNHDDSEVHVFNTEQKQLMYIISCAPTITMLHDCTLDVARNTLLIAGEDTQYESYWDCTGIDRYSLGDGKKQNSASIPLFDTMRVCHKRGYFLAAHYQDMRMVAYDVTSLAPSSRDLDVGWVTRVNDDYICQQWSCPETTQIRICSASDTSVQFPSINLTGLDGRAGYYDLQCDAFRVLLFGGDVLHVFDFASMNLD